MKRILSVLLIFVLLISSVLSVSAASADLTDEGKTVFTINDWTYTAIDGGSHYEIVEYVGTNVNLIIPRIVNDAMVVSLGNYSFTEDKNVKSVETSSPLWSVGDYAFLKCDALETFVCNFALKEIGIGAFSDTPLLKSINLENSVITQVKSLTFLNSGIEEVALPDTCTKISQKAFAQCEQLSKIIIPKSVTEIHEDAFKSSDNVVIYCYTDSYAHQYAETNGIEYVLIDGPYDVTFILGDADGDGTVTILDVTKIQRVLVELDPDNDGLIALRGDTNEDGLNILDATCIQRYIAGYEVADSIGEEVTRTINS